MKSEDVHRLIKSLESKRIDDGAALAALNDIRKHAMATKTGVQYLVKHSCVPSLLKLLYLIDEVKVRQQLVESGVVWTLAVLIKSENSDTVACAMRVLSELWVKMGKKVTERMSSEVVRAGVMKKIIEMVNSDDDMLSHQAFTVLLPLTQHPHAAALIGASEGVPFFLDLLVSPRWQHSQKEVISGLCQLAKEAVNRVKIREGGGLKVFLKTLRDDNLDGVHDRVMSALVSFLYDDTSLDVMLEDGLVDVLLTHLQDCGGYTSETPVNFCQDAKELLEISASGAATWFQHEFPLQPPQCRQLLLSVARQSFLACLFLSCVVSGLLLHHPFSF
nr:hypothetical protein BaRGS_007659 [Batillaria attramentaria]